jgi:transposase InsO family protein
MLEYTGVYIIPTRSSTVTKYVSSGVVTDLFHSCIYSLYTNCLFAKHAITDEFTHFVERRQYYQGKMWHLPERIKTFINQIFCVR